VELILRTEPGNRSVALVIASASLSEKAVVTAWTVSKQIGANRREWTQSLRGLSGTGKCCGVMVQSTFYTVQYSLQGQGLTSCKA